MLIQCATVKPLYTHTDTLLLDMTSCFVMLYIVTNLSVEE